MYLSRLEVVGFKSFAQKTSLAFDSGISAIVGPNGCGKSNVVDAIRWVLGEQRYSTLRSEKMEDVIFNGTKQRKALGMAEASLVIENTRGILPSEYTQVTVGRRVYRSGESEYLLNKVPCRLKDIIDLFMDTGMGSDAYSVIELKMIETILSDKTDERRRLFEEASGVTKYKHRRKAAYRKLESVQADLQRVNDIVAEVQKAVNSLERQARKAEQYNEVRDRLRRMEVDLLEREYAQFHARLIPLEERLGSLTADKSRIDGDLEQEEKRLETLKYSILEIDKRLAEAQRDLSQQADRMNQVEQLRLVAAERSRALTANCGRYEQEMRDLGDELAATEEQRLRLGREIAELEAKDRTAGKDLAARQEELRAFGTQVEAKKAVVGELRDRTIALVHEIAGRQTEQDRRKGRVEDLQGRSAQLDEECTAYAHEKERVHSEIESMSAEDRTLRRVFTETEMRFYTAEKERAGITEERDDVQRRLLDTDSEIDRKRAQMDFLRGLVESREGSSEGVHFLAASDEWTHDVTTVADVVHAPAEYRVAVESALGDRASLVVAASLDHAEHAIAMLKEHDKGKATFVCLDRLPSIATSARPLAGEGIRGWATDLARCDEQYLPLLRFLLDGVLIVNDRAAALAVARRIAGVRCVTLEGEVVTGTGIARGGSRRKDEGGTIGKQQQILELAGEIEILSAGRTRLQEQARILQERHDAIDLRALTGEVKSVEKEMNGVEMRIAQLEFEKKRAGDIIARNREDIDALRAEITSLEGEIASAAPDIERRAAEKAEVERAAALATIDLAALEEEWERRNEAVNDLGLDRVRVAGELVNARNDIQRAGAAIEGIHATRTRRQEEMREAQEGIRDAAAQMEEHRLSLDALRGELRTIEERRIAVEGEGDRVRADMRAIELRLKDERRFHDESLQASHDLELKIADLKGNIGHVSARAREEFDLAIGLKSYPEDEFVDFAALRTDIQALKDRMRSLGNVNFAAFEEYTAEKERLEFLTTQRTDLLEAEKTLLSTIEEINMTAQKKFLETFALIRSNFIDIFKSLFDPGDECDITLEENVDPLEAAVDIIAKPRGKRPTSIHLLSGGEKTLTAIALLFAIYLVKPSPFCILDEVDAPLDDANIDRFTKIIRKFSDNTQFIVVTHNKRTMEAANALYGVTMEEEGVSKLVTVRFNQGATVTSATIAAG